MNRRFHRGNGHGEGRPAAPGFAHRVTVAVGIACAALVLLWLTYKGIDVLLTMFGGIVFAVLLYTLAEPLTRWTRMPIWASVVTVTILIAGALSLAGWLLAPSVSRQFNELSDQLPAAIDRVRAELQSQKWSNWIMDKGSQATSSGQSILMQVTKVFSITLSVGAAFAIVAFLGLYLAAQPSLYIGGLIRLFPVSFRPRAAEVLGELYRNLRVYLLTKLVSMAFVAVLVGLGLWAMHVPLALSLALLAGLLEFIPTIGPLLSAAPAVLLAFVHSPMSAVWVAVLYFAVQWVQNHVTNPLLQQKALQLPSGLSLLLVALLGAFFGFGGLLLSGPLSVVVLVLVKRLYVEDVLERRRPVFPNRPRMRPERPLPAPPGHD